MMERPDTPTLLSARLILRPFALNDVNGLHKIMVEPGMMQYFPNPGPPQISRVQTLIERQLMQWSEHGYGWWALEVPDSGHLIGWCGLQYLPETGENEVGYLLKKSYWGKGLATEAGELSMAYGFKNLNFEMIIGIVHPENIASRRVLEKLGLKSPRPAQYFGIDCLRYEINRQDYFQTNPPTARI
jgi:ribosomal-protein-alanine N-acetyltransferase